MQEKDSLEEDAKFVQGLEDHIKTLAPQQCTVFDCNWAALDVFLTCTTQWRFKPTGEINALDYSSINAVIDLMEPKRRRRAALFRKVILIERGALEALSKHQLKNATTKQGR